MTTSYSSSLENKIILIVDDQEQNIKVVGTVLTMTGYEVIPASSGEQALKRLAARTPDLILLDVMMPEMDGIEVCRQIKAEPRLAEIPVIFLSAADDKNLIVQALECGGVDYVTKPFNKAELLTRVRTHLALKDASDQLRHLAEDKDELLGILAHDLKNHLAGMILSAGLLQQRAEDLPPRSVTLVDNIVQSSDRMMTFVNEFLANQSAEHLNLEREPLDIKALLQQSAVAHQPAANAKSITLELDLPGESVVALADHEGVSQVLDNLLTNALKFSRTQRKVWLSATAGTTDWVEFNVRDEGPGFTDEDKQKMFRRYGRLSARPTGGEPSAGLGLSIVKRLVESMDGRITVESEHGKGASFVVRLPAAPPLKN